jgi:hypothetical protein
MASRLAMPMLILNVGTEMVYILEQRLEAQNVSSDKSAQGILHWISQVTRFQC